LINVVVHLDFSIMVEKLPLCGHFCQSNQIMSQEVDVKMSDTHTLSLTLPLNIPIIQNFMHFYKNFNYFYTIFTNEDVPKGSFLEILVSSGYKFVPKKYS